MKNGGYRIMDQLAARQGGTPSWPSFDVDTAAIARSFGCEAVAIGDEELLHATLDDVVPGLRDRTSPLLLEVTIEPEAV
jgi:benzoylformate decarboxylase